ncbi:hypothetical protein [Pelagibius marinus]|uniref:hypothetical protein n=1 Tax=Pelagibius marinus TaxID=2762760 RepID=UPI00187217EE|nr:hypothetical protein [Pelagibius marinus]
MITLRNHDLLDGQMIPMTEYRKLRLIAIIPVAFVLMVLNLIAYEAFLTAWPKVTEGPDLSFLTYVLPAAGEAYTFHAACGYPHLAFLYAAFVIFNLLGIVALDIAALRLAARLLPIYKTVRRPLMRLQGNPILMIGVMMLLISGLAVWDSLSPHDCAGIVDPSARAMVIRAAGTAWLAMAIQSLLR